MGPILNETAARAGRFAFNRIDSSCPHFLIKEVVPQLALSHVSLFFSILCGVICLRGNDTGYS